MAGPTNVNQPRLSDLKDEELDYLLSEYQKSNSELSKLSDEELDQLAAAFAAPTPGPAEKPQLTKPAPSLSTGEMIGGGLREFAGGATFEFGDEAEAAVRAPFSDKSYEDLLKEIRQSRAQFTEAYPGTALGLNLAGGVGSMLVPGAAAVGRGAQALTRIDTLASPLARTAASGALAGTVAGIGSGEDLGQRLQYGATGATLGGALGAGAHGIGQGSRWVRDVFSERGSQAADAAANARNRAAEIISRRMDSSGMDAVQARQLADLERQYGIEPTVGMLSPELARLTENVLGVPSDSRGDLARRLFEQQADAPRRVQERIQQSIPTPDYFASEEQIVNTLRENANAAYGAAYSVGEIRDPRIMEVLQDPDIRSAYADALGNVRRKQTEAMLRGEDPNQYKLRELFDVEFDEQGNVVGMSPTGQVIPDMQTLDQIKQALDRRVTSLYSSGQGGAATALRGVRDAFVRRLDEVGPPEYREARAQYKGDIEVRDALEQGRKASTLRWQQVRKLANDYTPGELAAFKTGYVQHLLQGFENTSRNRNFARELIEAPNRRKSLEALMDPDEFKVFEAALRREAELFDTINRTTGGSQTFARAAERADIENQIASGNIDTAVDLLLNPTPGNLARRALQAFANLRNANVSRDTYNELAKMLKAGSPAEIQQTLDSITQAAPVQKARDVGLEGRTTRGAVGASSVIAPSPELDKERLPENPELVVPDLGLSPGVSGLSAMPAGQPQSSGPQTGEGSGDLLSVLQTAFPGMQTVLADGRVGGVNPDGTEFEVQGADVAKALGVPMEVLLRALGGY